MEQGVTTYSSVNLYLNYMFVVDNQIIAKLIIFVRGLVRILVDSWSCPDFSLHFW